MNSAKEENPTTSRLCLSTSRGLLVSFISGLFISVVTLLVKYLKDIYPGQLSAYRFWAVASLTLPQLILAGKNILGPPGYRLSIILVSFTNTSAIFLQFLTFRYLPLGEAAVIVSCYPIFVAIAGKIFLKETFGLLQVISLLATIIGMILTTNLYQTFFNNNRVYTTQDIYGITAGLAAALSGSMSFIFTRNLKTVHFTVLAFSIGIVGTVGSTVITGAGDNFCFKCVSFLEGGLILLIGLFSYLGNMCLIVSLQYAEAGPVSILRSASDIFFSFLWQVIIFGDVPDGIAIFGAALVSISIVLLGQRQRIKSFLPDKCAKLC